METLDLALEILLKYSYLGVVLLILTFSFVLPLSKTLVFVGAGVLAAEGYGNPYVYIAIALITTLFADSIYYSLGRVLQQKISTMRLYQRYQQKFDMANERISQHAWHSVLVSRLLPYLRIFIYIVAGMNRMPYLEFVLANSITTSIYIVASLMAGYFLAENREVLVAYIHEFELYLAIAAVLLLAVYIAYRRKHAVATKAQL